MKTILAYKTETNGLPDWIAPSDASHQPHIVRLSAILFNAETKEKIDYFDVLVRPDGWSIPQEAINSHGITEEAAEKLGIDESAAIELFHKLLFEAGDEVIRVTSNKYFNSRIIRIASKRFLDEEKQQFLANKENHFCVGSMAKGFFNVKQISIDDAYSHFENDIESISETSLGDAEKAAKVYFAINGKE